MKDEKRSTPPDDGNMRSPKESAPSRPWTEEERNEAIPLPLPSVPGTEKAPTTITIPHKGKGQTSPAGKPETL